jgi:hypothetical protein
MKTGYKQISLSLLFTVIGFVLIIGASPVARAAPQILAAIETHSPQPFSCENGICQVEIATFCLQKARNSPEPATLYYPHTDTELTLVLDDKTHLPVNDYLTIKSKRGFTAVVAEIPEAVIQDLGAMEAALSVGAGAILLPVAIQGDSDPIGDKEIKHALETLLPLANLWIEGTQELAAAIALMNALINATPHTEPLSSIDREGLWQKTIRSTDPQLLAKGSAIAKEIFDACLWRAEIKRYPTIRACLELKHDTKLMDMNLSYWQATAASQYTPE